MRTYHVVVWGASGFTGRLVCEHLAKDYAGKVKWAMAGRSMEKLEAVKAELVEHSAAAKDVPLVLADLQDVESLTSMTASTEVLISTVGPYARLGRPIVQACVKTQTHYCDLTGEAQFVRRMIDEFHDAAAASGTRIVHACGYDSVPSDVAALQAADWLKSKGTHVKDAYLLLVDAYGGVSGGTIESIMNLFSEGSATLKLISHPYCLVPEKAAQPVKSLPDQGEVVMPMHHREAGGAHSGPFIMSSYNSAIVRRSNALLDYGEGMTYTERTKASGWLGASAMSAFLMFAGMTMLTVSRVPFLRKFLPMPGSGPSRDVMQKGHWKHETIARGEAPDGQDAPVVSVTMQDPHRDPGYWGTSRLLLECALAMALQQDEIRADPYAGKVQGGVLTPASAMGFVLLERLRNAGITSEVTPVSGPGAASAGK